MEQEPVVLIVEDEFLVRIFAGEIAIDRSMGVHRSRQRRKRPRHPLVLAFGITPTLCLRCSAAPACVVVRAGPKPARTSTQACLLGTGPLAPLGADKDLSIDPTVDVIIDGLSHSADLLFADDFVVVANSADGVMPLLSDPLQLTGKVKEQWGKLTDDDLTVINGKQDQLRLIASTQCRTRQL